MASTRRRRRDTLMRELGRLARALEREHASGDHFESGVSDPETGVMLDHGAAARAVREAMTIIREATQTQTQTQTQTGDPPR